MTTGSGAQQAGSGDLAALKKLSIAELTDIEITSVSRTSESLRGAAAAVVVVTSEDIHRSGASTVPDVLRGLPGIYVGQRNSSSWAIGSRGFSSVNSEKLLVLSDTRSIYTPLFSGVQWDVQNYLMEDIDRIEVIRGPGATQWGSNAVNGVINITTKSARDTQGFYAEAGGGSEERAVLALRNGGRIGERGYYRVFGQYFDRDASQLADPASLDDWHMGHVGFRTDWEAGAAEALTVQGDWYDGRIGQVGPAVTIIGRPGPAPPLRSQVHGGNILGRWHHTIDEDSNFELRAYYDRTHRDDPSFHDDLDTVDVDFQHHFVLPSQRITWGLNYRHTSNLNVGKGVFAVDPPRAGDDLFSGFLQDQIVLLDSLQLTLGSKVEHNDFSGFEVQPSARLAWDLSREQTLWAAVSRAVRVPTRLERDIAIQVTVPGEDPAAFLLGNHAFESERLLAYELGYRWQISPRLSLDAASFVNRYKGLASLEIEDPFVNPAGTTIFPIRTENLTSGRAAGAELLANFAATDRWRLTGSYSYLHLKIEPHGQDQNRGAFVAGSTPRHQFGLRSAVDVHGVQIDAFLRREGAIRSDPQIVTGEGIAAYTELDLRAARAWNRLEFELQLRNLLHDGHLEFGAPAQRGEIERSVHAGVTWRSR
ncbi:MAG TPA: TonB-dependent receptor [Steroidobacteraceae bacterium]|nr:TonB-dependent receptor [Steroidobacteraceae bacterium]